MIGNVSLGPTCGNRTSRSFLPTQPTENGHHPLRFSSSLSTFSRTPPSSMVHRSPRESESDDHLISEDPPKLPPRPSSRPPLGGWPMLATQFIKEDERNEGREEHEDEDAKDEQWGGELVPRPRCLVHHRRRRHSMSAMGDYEGLRLLRWKVWRSSSSSCSYMRLPESKLRLLVLKLDGSSFDVEVGRSGTVAELKVAVEEVFRQSLKERESKISWSHVWSNFCLCYGCYKLIDGKASLQAYGVKDGDQLHFVRHLSINYSPLRRLPRRRLENDSEKPSMSLAEEDINQGGEDGSYIIGDELYPYMASEDKKQQLSNEVLHHSELTLARILRGWLSYTRLWCTWRTRAEPTAQRTQIGAFIARELERKNWAKEGSDKRTEL